MLAHFHGQIWNGSEFARSIGTSEPTARRYLDILSGAFVVRQLQPWYENIKKRQVKAPKVYIRDTGILHSLLMLEGDQVLNHPKLGSSWEGFIVEQLIARYSIQCFYWATHAGAELDLFTFIGGKRIGFEIKYSDAPQMTKSIHSAIEDLSLEKVFIIYPGEKNYPVQEKVEVIAARKIFTFAKAVTRKA